MFDPEQSTQRLHQAHQRLFERLEGLTDDAVRRPSLLPGWTVGHVLAHLARNADSVVRRLAGAARNEVVDQYPGGVAGRAAEIDAGAGRPAAELVADVRQSALAAEQVAATLPAAAWERLTRAVEGNLAPASAVLLSRIREVEVHHVDLALGYTPKDWPADFIQDTLARELPKLPNRADSAELLGWLIGRGPAPELPPWG
ncbi:MAG TPA: maleylpyruvate isomerase N-terminal domain-containing protein [Kineosporiaceae bacterium]|nr:maleylpyruvate isomerase N-terminal domain-containing protein [Kineosporiaceae bacterium]